MFQNETMNWFKMKQNLQITDFVVSYVNESQ
jgi:hypothetical protein